MVKRKTIDEFVKQASQIHNNKYDYSKSQYINAFQKIIIICPEHGEFKQQPHDHLYGKGCDKCGIIKSRFKQINHDFINQANKIHSNKYDYSKVIYKNNKTKVVIICQQHGEFKQVALNHLRGQGCSKCAGNYINHDFINQANKIHNNKYDYSKVIYKNNKTKVVIICPQHGEFKQIPNTHLSGQGCCRCVKVTSIQTR